jgi:hypothetical protein
MNGSSNPAAPVSPEYMARAMTRVRIFTPSGVVEGRYSHATGVRLSDSLRNAGSSERYILLTDVKIRSLEGESNDGRIDDAPFVLLRAEHASLIIPLDEE